MLSIIIVTVKEGLNMSYNLNTLDPGPRIQVFLKLDSEFYDKIRQTPLLRVL